MGISNPFLPGGIRCTYGTDTGLVYTHVVNILLWCIDIAGIYDEIRAGLHLADRLFSPVRYIHFITGVKLSRQIRPYVKPTNFRRRIA